jgi:uncharacterized small protein (DUF1192 family)
MMTEGAAITNDLSLASVNELGQSRIASRALVHRVGLVSAE